MQALALAVGQMLTIASLALLGTAGAVIAVVVSLRLVWLLGTWALLRGRRSHVVGLGMGVHDDHWGKGIATALMTELVDVADNWFAIRRLELSVFTDNARAIRLYEKFGFVPEGVRRAFAFRAGAYADALSMARLRL